MYTLHRVAVNEWNAEPYFAMRNSDGEAFNLYDEDDMRAVYEMLHAYFTAGIISDEPFEIEEIEGNWKQTWQAVKLAREYRAPASYTDDRIGNTIRKAAKDGRIAGAHQSIDGSGEWWYPLRQLEQYLSGLTWKERKPIPSTKYPAHVFDNAPFGSSGLTIADALADGQEIVHQHDGTWYRLHLDDNGQIVGVIDEEHYKDMNQPIPAQATGRPVVRPSDRKAQNVILKQYGYRWEKFDREWLEDNDEFDREPGWYLFHGEGRETRELGQGGEAVDQAFDEINRGVDVVAAEQRQKAEEAKQRVRAARERIAVLTRIRDQIMQSGERPQRDAWPAGEKLFDTHNIYGGGDSFVIAEGEIWYIRGNGMDGDDWSRNNLPVSIGWRIAYSNEIAAELRSLAGPEQDMILCHS